MCELCHKAIHVKAKIGTYWFNYVRFPNAIEEYESGSGTYSLGNKYNCHHAVIGNYLKRNGVKLRDKSSASSMPPKGELLKALNTIGGITNTAHHFNVGRTTLGSWNKQYDIKCIKRATHKGNSIYE